MVGLVDWVEVNGAMQYENVQSKLFSVVKCSAVRSMIQSALGSATPSIV